MNKIIIISIFLSAILTTIVFSIFIYVLDETNVGDWIANLVIHPQVTYQNALFVPGLIFSR